jgi:uncharacterized membrane protein YhiD involved in acid resistance
MGEITFNDLIKKSFLKLDVFAKISIFDVVVVVLLTLLVGMFIFYIYKKTFRGVVYNYSFNAALVMMCLITSLIIMTISSNVVLSLGMVGALSIVRFRTALKDPMDIVFMFWAIAAGIASGAGIYPVSIIGSLFVGGILLGLSKIKPSDEVFLLVIHYEESAADEVKRILNKIPYVLKSKTVTSKNTELTVEIRIRDNNTAIVNELSVVSGVIDAVLVSYNGEYAA